MEKNYPHSLDKPLIEALKMATANDDREMMKKLWDLLVSYRKSK